jgi:hypothetical protein
LDKQQEVLDHVKSLGREVGKPNPPQKSGRGLWADLNVDLSAEEIDEARDEMWSNFPRDDFWALSENSWNSPETRPFSEMGFVV